MYLLRLTQLYNMLLLSYYWPVVSVSMDHHQANTYKKNLNILVHTVLKRQFYVIHLHWLIVFIIITSF